MEYKTDAYSGYYRVVRQIDGTIGGVQVIISGMRSEAFADQIAAAINNAVESAMIPVRRAVESVGAHDFIRQTMHMEQYEELPDFLIDTMTLHNLTGAAYTCRECGDRFAHDATHICKETGEKDGGE